MKDYDLWNFKKKEINTSDSSNLYFREREIWWCHLGANVGTEQDGKGSEFMRPALIFKKFNSYLCWVIPLSSKMRVGSFFFPLLAKSNKFRIAILPQMRLIDSKRLIEKIDSISILEHSFVKERITAFTQ